MVYTVPKNPRKYEQHSCRTLHVFTIKAALAENASGLVTSGNVFM
jgi:hypothetical protein